jgi:hypothetical protein
VTAKSKLSKQWPAMASYSSYPYSRMWQCIRGEDLDAFGKCILHNVKIVHFVTYQPASAIDIFNTLNRRGLESQSW